MSFDINIVGLDATIKKVEGLARNTRQRADNALLKFGNDVARDAKINLQRGSDGRATSNTGKLAGSINVDKVENGVSITVATKYAAFVEFGTRKFAAQYVATLPKDWQDLAARFKDGSGGTFDEMVLAIFQWVKDRKIKPNPEQFEQGDTFRAGKLVRRKKKKRINLEAQQQQLAYVIALKILRDGVRPQPYLRPAVLKNIPELKKAFKNIFR